MKTKSKNSRSIIFLTIPQKKILGWKYPTEKLEILMRWHMKQVLANGSLGPHFIENLKFLLDESMHQPANQGKNE